jgi:hypothetical protein
VCCCAGEHVVVPLLCLSGVVPCPTGENGTNSGRVLVNLDLTNAQPATGDAPRSSLLSLLNVAVSFFGGGVSYM